MSEPALSVRIRIIGSRARSIWPCALAACPVSAIPCHRGALGLVRRLPVCPLAGPAAIVHASAGAGEVAGGRGLRTATCTIHGRCRPCHCCPGGGGACWRQRRLLQLPAASAAAHHSGLLHLGHEQAVLLERCLRCLWGQKGIKKCQLEAGDDHRGDGMCSCPCLNLNLITSGLQSIAYIGLPGNAPASCCYLLAAAITGTPHRAAAFTTRPGVFFSASTHGFQAPYSPS